MKHHSSSRRSDGICPACEKNYRHVTSSGDLTAYCLECHNIRQRKAVKNNPEARAMAQARYREKKKRENEI